MMYLLPISIYVPHFWIKCYFVLLTLHPSIAVVTPTIYNRHLTLKMEITYSVVTMRLFLQHTTVLSPRRWRQPTQRQRRDWATTYNHPLAPKTEITHSEAATRLFHKIQPSSRPEDGDNPLRDSNSSITYNHPLAPKIETTNSEATTRFLYNNRTSIHTPRRWDFPNSKVTTRLFCWWDFPHLEKCLYVLFLGFPPLRDGNADMPTGLTQ